MVSFMERLARLDFQEKGYLIDRNVFFPLPSERTMRGLVGWGCIDMVVHSAKECIIVHCESRVGATCGDLALANILSWFRYTEEFVLNSPAKPQVSEQGVRKLLIIDQAPASEATKELAARGVEVRVVDYIIKAFFEKARAKLMEYGAEGFGTQVGEEDVLFGFIQKLVAKDIGPRLEKSVT